MPDKKDLNIDELEAVELEDSELEDVSGGTDPINGTSCPTTNGSMCSCQPAPN
jgi:hypothetical protein